MNVEAAKQAEQITGTADLTKYHRRPLGKRQEAVIGRLEELYIQTGLSWHTVDAIGIEFGIIKSLARRFCCQIAVNETHGTATLVANPFELWSELPEGYRVLTLAELSQ